MSLPALASALGFALRRTKRVLPAGLRRDVVLEHIAVALELVAEIQTHVPETVRKGGLPLLATLAGRGAAVGRDVLHAAAVGGVPCRGCSAGLAPAIARPPPAAAAAGLRGGLHLRRRRGRAASRRPHPRPGVPEDVEAAQDGLAQVQAVEVFRGVPAAAQEVAASRRPRARVVPEEVGAAGGCAPEACPPKVAEVPVGAAVVEEDLQVLSAFLTLGGREQREKRFSLVVEFAFTFLECRLPECDRMAFRARASALRQMQAGTGDSSCI